MQYKLYSTVDITHTNQYRFEFGKERLHWQEQNFNTVIQTLSLRTNITYSDPEQIVIQGNLVGFNTTETIRVWTFSFYTDRADVFKLDHDPVRLLKQDFEMVPFISGLSESMQQNYSVFVTDGLAKNIEFIPLNI